MGGTGSGQVMTEENRARAERMLKAYVHDDMTLEQISKYHGITRERVRQLLNKIDPTLYKLAVIRKKARRRLQSLGNSKKDHHVRVCTMCGEVFFGQHNGAFCTPMHRQVWLILRYQINETFREQTRKSHANWIMKNDDTPRNVVYAENLLKDCIGESGSKRAGVRYLQQGSLAFHWAVRAYVLDWPVFENFHPEVQQQIKDYVD